MGGFTAAAFRSPTEAPPVDASYAYVDPREGGTPLTLVWFVIWLIWNVVGDNESLSVDPVNWWAGTLILAVALDLSRQHAPQLGKTSRVD